MKSVLPRNENYNRSYDSNSDVHGKQLIYKRMHSQKHAQSVCVQTWLPYDGSHSFQLK